MSLVHIGRDALRDIGEHTVALHFFSYAGALLHALSVARASIYICAYVMKGNLKKKADPVYAFMSFLKQKQGQGLDIRVILDSPKKNRPNFHTNRYFMRRLYDAGIPFGIPKEYLTCHSKVISIDGQVLFCGSHNLTKRSFLNPLECTAEIRNVKLVAQYNQVFNEYWKCGALFRYPPLMLDMERIYP